MVAQQSLSTAFKERDRFFAHRSSAVFPLLLNDDADLHIVFLNYWKLKNGIESIAINFRVYDSSGFLVERVSLQEVADHNSISVRNDILPERSSLPFSGMIEVEVTSTDNLRFTFPAIIGVYESKGYFSCVHSAGRVKNADELKLPFHSEETNWTCKFVEGADGWAVIPFFHYFVGAQPLPDSANIEAIIRRSDGKIVDKRIVDIGGMRPFSSTLFFADEIFDLAGPPPEGAFMSVKLTAHDIFPRLVVGNFHRDLQFLEVTHSFPSTEIEDYCPTQEVGGRPFNSMLSAQTSRDLTLSVHVFPTNCAGEALANVRHKKFEQDQLADGQASFRFQTSPGQESLSFVLEDWEELRVLGLSGPTVPSRLNASFRYSVKGSGSKFSTDIATGAKSIVYPPKFHHWGHGCIGGGFNTQILYHNNSHDPASTPTNQGSLRIIGKGFNALIPIEVASESCLAVNVIDELALSEVPNSPTFISWYLSMDKPVGEAFWVAFREDGAVLGEHAF